MKRACIYARVSTSRQAQEGTSLDTQIEALLRAARQRGDDPRHVLREEGFTGTTIDRPILNEAKELARQGQIDRLYIYSWDRLTRDTKGAAKLLYDFEELWGVEVVCVTQPKLPNEIDTLYRFLMSWAAEIDNNRRRESSLRGRRERARRGKIVGGFRLYGTIYNPKTGTREKDPQTYPVLLSIFRWLAQGETLYRIAHRLVDAGIPAPRGGKRWHTSTLARIVRRKEYIGKTVAWRWKRVKRNGKSVLTERPREEWIEQPNATPALIPEELFWQAQKQLRRNAKLARRGLKQKYLLRGHIRCRCGAAMHGRGSTKRKERYYQCWRATTKAEVDRRCYSKMIRADKLEPLVWEEIKKVLLNPQLILAEVEERIQSNNPKSIDKEIEVIEKKLAQLDLEERRLIRLYGKHIVTEKTLADEVDRVKTERGSWVEELRTLEARKRAWLTMKKQALTLEDYCRRASRNIERFTFDEKRRVLEALDVEVRVDGGQVTIVGYIPHDLKRANLPSQQQQPARSVAMQDISQDSRTRSRRGSPEA